MLSTLLVSFPSAEIENFCSAADAGTVMVSVSLLLPVYPDTLAPTGRAEVSRVYPLLMFVRRTEVCPLKPLPLAVSCTVEVEKSMLCGSSCLARAFASSSSAYSRTCSYPLLARMASGLVLRLVKL